MKKQNRTNLLIDSISIGICIIDKNYKVLHWNDYIQDYTQIRKEEIIGKPIIDFFPEFGLDLYKDLINSIFEGWPPVFLSSRLHNLFNLQGVDHKEKVYNDVTISSLITDDEKEYNALISINDVSDLNKKLEERNQLYRKAKKDIEIREKIQRELEESDKKYRELNRTKDKLISIISHDLRSPFTVLLGYIDILKNGYSRMNDERRIQIVHILFDAINHTMSLVENILTWARNQVNGVECKPSNFQLDELVDCVVVNLEYIAANKDIAITVNKESDQWVHADKDMVHTVLRNLISNAIKYSMKKSEIIISVLNENQSFLSVEVKDFGVGMSEESSNNLFKVGKTKSVAGTDNEQGTGFGLILCKEFVEANKGALTFESSMGTGSSFKFTLPVKSEEK